MKKKIPILVWGSAIALLACTQAVAAVEPTKLDVTGTIKAPTCAVTAGDNDGEYDYGAISSAVIKPGKTHTALNPKAQTWTVSCDAKTFLTFQVFDREEASNSSPSNTTFGLGNIHDTGKIGYYKVQLRNATVDTNKVYVGYNVPGVSRTTGYVNNDIHSGYNMTWVDRSTAVDGAQLVPGQNFSMEMEVQPYLGGSETMNGALTESVPLKGLMTLNYAFGI